jgi:hypothetical protein
VHRDQHSTIQMDRLNNKYRPRSDTHHFDPTLSSSGCRPRGRCASAPPGQSCAVRQRIRLWQRRGAARRSRPSVWEERPLLRRESIGMILAFSYINLVLIYYISCLRAHPASKLRSCVRFVVFSRVSCPGFLRLGDGRRQNSEELDNLSAVTAYARKSY